MSVSSINTRNRVAGLASGLDTEELVNQMTSLAKSKVNTQQQKIDKLSWKQSDYRSVITDITNFQNKFFNLLTPSTNLSSASLFGATKSTSTNEKMTCSSTSSATSTSYNITNIIQKATKASLEGTKGSVEGINLDFSKAESGTEYTVSFTLDGSSKEVTFTGGADADATKANFLNALNDKFSSTDVTFEITDNNRLVANDANSVIHSFSIKETTDTKGTAPELEALGLDSSVSSRVSLNTKLSDVAFKESLKGNGFSFSINDVEFSFDKSSTINNVISAVNKSGAGVKMSFNTLTGAFDVSSTVEGADASMTIKQTAGNLLSCMFGSEKIAESNVKASALLMSNGLEGNALSGKDTFAFAGGNGDILEDIVNSTFNVTINGQTKEIGLWQYNSSGVRNDFSKSSSVLSELNSELSKQFGDDAPTVSYDSKSNQFTFTTASKSDVISISAKEDTTGASEKLVKALGFNSTNSTNEITGDIKPFEILGDTTAVLSFGNGGVVIDKNTTLDNIIEASKVIDNDGNEVSCIELKNGVLFLKGIDYDNCDEAGKRFLGSIFGEGYNYPGIPPTNFVTEYTSEGTNAILEVNGAKIANTSNSVTIDGTTFDISKLDVGEQDITVKTEADTSKAYEAIKSFVEDYNTLIGSLYSKITTAPATSDGTLTGDKYEPLTDDQRDEMSDKEIELWEEKAKTGLLYQDQTIQKFLTKLRSAVSGSLYNGKGIYDFGITVSNNYKDNGKLEIDEAKLKAALEKDPSAAVEFFTAENTGFAAKVNSVLEDTVNTSIANEGTLVRLAGVSNGYSVNNNIISKQIQQYSDYMDDLQDKYEEEQERYWSQFSFLESMMSTYNSQSEWLTSQFSS